jgi:hypothetical protein
VYSYFRKGQTPAKKKLNTICSKNSVKNSTSAMLLSFSYSFAFKAAMIAFNQSHKKYLKFLYRFRLYEGDVIAA